MQLTKNFSLEEMIFSQTAIRNKIDNTPSDSVISKFKILCAKLEEVRMWLNKFIIISSGFRCLKLNTAIGSKDTSQHVKGEAVDFKCPKYGTPREIVQAIKISGIIYDQLILEYDSWVHLSFKGTNDRKQTLIIDNKGTRIFS